MNDYREVIAIVEGKTEQDFIRKIVAPYLSPKGIYLSSTQVSKSGQKGGDVKFSKVKRDVGNFLNQRSDTVVTTFLDLYGLKEWPGLESILKETHHDNMIEKLYRETDRAFNSLFNKHTVDQRIIPFFAVYEFEALLFSNPEKLARKLNCHEKSVISILSECGEPEKINNSPNTAPSKRLDQLTPRGKFKKITEGIALASDIGIETMREQCPQFNHWLNNLENLIRV